MTELENVTNALAETPKPEAEQVPSKTDKAEVEGSQITSDENQKLKE